MAVVGDINMTPTRLEWRNLTKAAFENTSNGLRKGVMLFLSFSTFFEFLCIFLCAIWFPKLPIVKYYIAPKQPQKEQKLFQPILLLLAFKHQQTNRLKMMLNFCFHRQNKDYLLDLFLIYVLTLSIFPGFLFENTGQHQLGSWYPLVLIAMYNVFDLIGRYIPLVERLNLSLRKGLMVAIIFRYLLVPAYYFAGKYADQGYMIFLTSFLGLTNGYLTVGVFTAAPKGYKVSYIIYFRENSKNVPYSMKFLP